MSSFRSVLAMSGPASRRAINGERAPKTDSIVEELSSAMPDAEVGLDLGTGIAIDASRVG